MKTILLFILLIALAACTAAPAPEASLMPAPEADAPEMIVEESSEEAMGGAEESAAPDNHDAEPFNADGELLVDDISPYIIYNDHDFEHAREHKKVIFLEFYADWCPYCRKLDPQIRETFANLDDPDVVGFRVNYDKDVDVKKQYNVVYQHTHIILDRDGNVVYKGLETEWVDSTIVAVLNEAKGE